jgi:hypothetical protein
MRFRVPLTKELLVYWDTEMLLIVTQSSEYKLVWENYVLLGVLRLRPAKYKIVQEDLEKMLEECLIKSVPIEKCQEFLKGCGDELSDIKIFEGITP